LKSDRGSPAFALDGLRRGERGYHGLAIRKAGKEEEEEGIARFDFRSMKC
jgi:hypothetical protein